MISRTSGSYSLAAGGASLSGKYTFQEGDPDTGTVVDERLGCVGRFSMRPIRSEPFDAAFFGPDAKADGRKTLPVVRVVVSEIMEAIQDPSNDGAFFVLPSQLNGAEYPSYAAIVTQISDYRYDNTGGPRGQLAVHPAPGQFILDNAETTARRGINAIDRVLAAAQGHGFELVNGYLQMPEVEAVEDKDRALAAFRSELHTLRPLIMSDIPAMGLLPTRRDLCQARHSVGLVYASAVPVSSYMNRASNTPTDELHKAVAESVLIAQYYGAMAHIAERAQGSGAITVYLMPLGGGVFCNPIESIARAISLAVEALEDAQLLSVLDIRVLAWKGSDREGPVLTKLLNEFNKLSSLS